jgi:hypothetical protein
VYLEGAEYVKKLSQILKVRGKRVEATGLGKAVE